MLDLLSQKPEKALVADTQRDSLGIISETESNVRTYCRGTPYVFNRAQGSEIYDVNGRRFIDFMSAAGSLNYGHNDPHIIKPISEYLLNNGILQTLDFATEAKAEFIQKFRDVILKPRQLNHKIQFTGPTGTNAVEAAIKLARKYTGRADIATFTNAYHGVSLGALALTGNASKRKAAGIPLNHAQRLPYDGYFGNASDAAQYARRLYLDSSSGFERPAAFILETVQGEGGLNVASFEWIKAIERLAKELGSLLIVDDIQAGCGRTGSFFSFEPFDIDPDMICLSKSISGSGLPMAIVLLKQHLDIWEPGGHNGTFRGNNLGFVGATAALDYWVDDRFEEQIARSSTMIFEKLHDICESHGGGIATPAGRGMFAGLRFKHPGHAELTREIALQSGVLAETSGPDDEVLKLMPPLNIQLPLLREGLELIGGAVRLAVRQA